MSWALNEYPDNQTLIKALSRRIEDLLRSRITLTGHASIAVSGGSTPAALYNTLANIDLPWSDVIVSLVDERWVDEDHPDSNAALIRKELIKDFAATARLVSMKTCAIDAFAGQLKLHRWLSASILPLDLVLLGMGNDGHTASLFPHAQGLEDALDTSDPAVCRALRPANMPFTRMSLSLRTLLEAGQRMLYIVGESKLSTLKAALEPGPVKDMPVRAILHADNVDTDIFYAPC
jgi:6-phosphogluconolactonase